MGTTSLASSFKQELFNAVHNFGGGSPHTFKMLLIKAGATGTYDGTLTNVGTPGSGSPSAANVGTDEVTGSGYTTGGVTLASVSVALFSSTASVTWGTSPSWPSSTISAIGAIIYNSSASGKIVGYFDFGGTITDTNGTFTATMPTAGASTSIIRFA